MANWILVPPLVDLTNQLNERFPKRDTATDGSKGDESHAGSTSSHNPDKTGKPEWRDGDSKNEVRAKDLDKDLRDPNTTMEQVVQEWVRLCRSGKIWWVRYIIFNKRIWHQSDGFKTHAYKGKNKHDKHVHVTSGFSQKVDELTGTNWGLKNFRKPKPPVVYKPKDVKTDGVLGPETIKLWQHITKQKITGKMDSAFVRWLQGFLKRVDHRIKVDGDFGPKTIAGLQRYLKSPVDGVISKPKSHLVVALQRRLNTNKF